MKTSNKIENNNLIKKENLIMKTTKTLNQTILTIAIVLLSVVTFAQDNGNSENPFTTKKFKTIRGDVNKSNPVEGLTLEYANTGNGNQIETNYVPNRKLNVKDEVYYELPQKRQSLENNSRLSSRNLHNYPNPFASRTTIQYEVKRPAFVHLAVYQNGLLVKIVSSEFQDAGNHRVVFDASGLPAGSYTAVLTMGTDILTHTLHKVSVIKNSSNK